jgi:hypothetical protein
MRIEADVEGAKLTTVADVGGAKPTTDVEVDAKPNTVADVEGAKPITVADVEEAKLDRGGDRGAEPVKEAEVEGASDAEAEEEGLPTSVKVGERRLGRLRAVRLSSGGGVLTLERKTGEEEPSVDKVKLVRVVDRSVEEVEAGIGSDVGIDRL